MSENLKVELSNELADKITKKTYETWIHELIETVRKAKNKIQVGDLVRSQSVGSSSIIFFVCDGETEKVYMDSDCIYHTKSVCTKASPEECKVILPLLEK